MNHWHGKDGASSDLAMMFDRHKPPLPRQSKETNLVGLALGLGRQFGAFLGELIEDRVHWMPRTLNATCSAKRTSTKFVASVGNEKGENPQTMLFG
jgi:hypothetical protein